MTTTRRDFLAATSLGVAATALAPRAFAGAALGAPESLEILVMGGTGFLGPHLIHAALQRGHKVTMFNRGRTQPRIFVDQYEQVEALQGDRKLADGLAALGSERRWDAVLDTSAYFPRVVDMSVGLLKDRVRHYTLISTLSVYGTRNEINMDESTPVATIEDTTTEEITGASYGPLKALCEQAAEQLMPGRVANIRPGLIVGKGDNTDRYTYWVDRIKRGGRVLAPGSGDDYTQIIDVRDLAEWTVRVAEENTTGVFNAVTPAAGLNMRAMLEGIHEAAESDAEFSWVDEDFLEQHGVQAWQHMTAWVPASAPGYEGFGQTSTKRAQAAGLTTRTPVETARATLDWWLTLPEERRAQLRAGLDAATEAKVLAAWDERDG